MSFLAAGPCRLRMMINVFFLLVIIFADADGGNDVSCDSTNMMNCLLSLGDSSEKERLFFPDTQEKLSNYCRHLMKGLECANEILEKCASEEDKQMYRNLTYEMHGTNVDLCTEGSALSIRFLKHVGCFKKLSEKFKACSELYIGNILVVQGLSEEQHVKMTCCTVTQYNRCMRTVVSRRCDKEAADLVDEVVSRTLRTPMEYCGKLDDVPKKDCKWKFTPLSSPSSNNDERLDDDNDAASKKLSLMLLTVLLLRIMLFR